MTRKKNKLRLLLSLFFCLALMMCPIITQAAQAEQTQEQTEESQEMDETGLTFADLEGKTAGVLTGTPQEDMVRSKVENVTILSYNSQTDLALALMEKKIDFYVNSKVAFRIMQEQYPEFDYIDIVIRHFDMGAIFPKTGDGRNLKSELDTYIRKIKEDGTLDALKEYWLYPNDWEKVEVPKKGKNGQLNLACIATMIPYSFIIDGEYAGLDIAVLAGFCEEYGYGLTIENVDFSGALSGITTGKYDLACGQISYTQERAEKVLYSEFYCDQEIVPILLTESKEDMADGDSFLASLAASFKRTVLDEHRWVMILKGFGVTLLITLFGFLLANLVGAGLCAMAMSRNRLCNGLADIYSRIMQGTPIIVILMILYYIIFGRVKLSGLFVSILAFGLSSAAYLADLFHGAIKSVDKGQTEAGLAIGLSGTQTFMGIILPQAIRRMLTGYFSQLISLMKGTSVVGYIAVSDLTRVGDIIRSNTFEPFFPLIIVAVLYFAMASLLLSILKRIQKRLEPKRVKAEKKEGEKA